MTDTTAPLYRTGRSYGARKGVAAAVDHLRTAGYLEAARDLEDHAGEVAHAAFDVATRDQWTNAYSGAIARADGATRERTRDERDHSAGLEPHDH